MSHQLDYPSDTQIVHIDWHVFDTLMGNPSSTARGQYYGVNAAPDVWFDGATHELGAGDSVSAYNTYKPILANRYIAPSSFIVSALLDLNSTTMMGTVTVNVEVAPGETITNPSTIKIRAALYENAVSLGLYAEPQTGNKWMNYIARLMIAEVTLTASLSGQTQQVVQSFAIDPAWKIADLHAIAFLQRDTNKIVQQAAQAAVQYDCTLADLDPPVLKTNGSPLDFDSQLTYTGATNDDVVLTIDETALPAGWDAEIVWNSTTYASTVTIPNMTASQMEDVTVHVIPGAPGLGTVVFKAAPSQNPSLAVAEVRTYHTFSHTPAILFVDDDNAASFENIFEDAVLGAGYFSVTHDLAISGNPTTTWLNYFDAVIWSTGELPTTTIGPANQAVLLPYLDGGGRLFVSSQGYLNNQGVGPAFTTNYLRVSAFTADVGAPSVTGVAGDPIGNGLSFTLSPPFVNKADHIVPNTGGVVWLESGANDVGVRYDSGVFKTVFMTAPFEGVASPDDDLLMQRVLDWLAPSSAVDAPNVGTHDVQGLALYQNAPNPFGGSTLVRFAVPRAAHVALAVYDVAGRRVASLVDRRLEAGTHSLEWDGRDASGVRVASGVYLVRLQAAGEVTSREMVRVN